MIGRAATSAVRRVCSMLAPASKMNPDLNQSFKRFTTHGDVNEPFLFPADPTVKYTATASGELSPSLEVETSSDKPIFYLSRNFIDEIRDAYQLVKYNGQLSVFALINFSPDETDMAHWVRKNGEWVEVGVYHIYGDLRKPLGFARNDELLLFQRWCSADSLCSLMVFGSTTGELQHVPECVTRGDFMLLDFHDSSFLKLIPPSSPN